MFYYKNYPKSAFRKKYDGSISKSLAFIRRYWLGILVDYDQHFSHPFIVIQIMTLCRQTLLMHKEFEICNVSANAFISKLSFPREFQSHKLFDGQVHDVEDKESGMSKLHLATGLEK